MKFLIFGLAISLATIVSANYLKEKPAFLESCYLKDPNFRSCYANEFQSVFREWKNGIPGSKAIGKLDPIHVKRVKLSQSGGGSVNLHADMTNVVIKGASKVVVQDASLSKDITAKMRVLIPKLRFESDYKLDGRVLALVLNGHGKMHFEAENLLMTITVSNKLRDQDGLVFCDVEDVKVDVKDIKNFHIYMENLFNGQKSLEESINALVNQNWRDYFEVMRDPIQQTIQTVLVDRFRKIFKYVPSTYFVADIPTAADYNG